MRSYPPALAWVPRKTDVLALYLRLECDLGKQEKERGNEVGKRREQVQRGAFRKDAPATVSQDQLCGCGKREEFISNFLAPIFHQSVILMGPNFPSLPSSAPSLL